MGVVAGLAASATARDPSLDPKGTLAPRSWSVTTEAGEPGTLSIGPEDAWRGHRKADLAVVQLSDFECGPCKRMSATLDRLLDVYGDVVVYVYKDFPMNPDCNPGVVNKKHPHACDAAVAGECARRQHRFWAMNRFLFKNQHYLEADGIDLIAASVALDHAAFSACLADPEARAAVYADAVQGTALGVHGTPRVWVGEVLFRASASALDMGTSIEVQLGWPAKGTQRWRGPRCSTGSRSIPTRPLWSMGPPGPSRTASLLRASPGTTPTPRAVPRASGCAQQASG